VLMVSLARCNSDSTRETIGMVLLKLSGEEVTVLGWEKGPATFYAWEGWTLRHS